MARTQDPGPKSVAHLTPERTQAAMVKTLIRWPGITRSMLGAHTRQYTRSHADWSSALHELIEDGKVAEKFEPGVNKDHRPVAVYYLTGTPSGD